MDRNVSKCFVKWLFHTKNFVPKGKVNQEKLQCITYLISMVRSFLGQLKNYIKKMEGLIKVYALISTSVLLI